MASHREPLASADVAWLRMERPTNLMMISGVIMFEAPLDAKAFKTMLEERLLIFHRFKQCVTDPHSNPHWEDDPHFSVDRHVHRIALPKLGGPQELKDLVSDFMNAPLDFNKPPWDMHLVEDFGKGCALIVRLHHCIADGIALIHVLLSMADEYFDASKLPAVRKRPEQDDGLLTSLVRPVARVVTGTVKATGAVLHEGMEMILRPSRILERAKQGMSIGAATSKLLLMGADSDTVFKGELGVTKRAAWSEPMALQTIKDIGLGVGGKINDVLLATVTGAFRRYLLSHDEPVDDINIRATIPVNLRPLDEAHRLGNHFGLVFLSLPVGLAHPEARLHEVKRRMDRLKYSAEAPVTLGILQILGSVPNEVQTQVVNLLSRSASTVMTNVPGPREKLHFLGSGMSQMMFWVPRTGSVSTGVSIMSYNGEVTLGVATDIQLIPDPEAIVAAFHEEFDALQQQFA